MHSDPARFLRVLREFLDGTEPAHWSPARDGAGAPGPEIVEGAEPDPRAPWANGSHAAPRPVGRLGP